MINQPKTTPNETDLSIITKFFGLIGWADTCSLVQPLDSGRVYLHCGLYILVPCHFSELEASIENIRKVGEQWNTEPGVIISGEPGDYEWGRLNWLSHKSNLVTYWLSVESRLRYSQFIVQGLDGIEWWNPKNWKIANENHH